MIMRRRRRRRRRIMITTTEGSFGGDNGDHGDTTLRPLPETPNHDTLPRGRTNTSAHRGIESRGIAERVAQPAGLQVGVDADPVAHLAWNGQVTGRH
jgi:hypothetical protein